MGEWVEVCKIGNVPPSGLVCSVGEIQLLVINFDGKPYAISSTCSHQDMPLEGGRLDRDRWVCPHHGARFDIATGRHLSMPAASPVQAYQAKLDGKSVLVYIEKG